MALIKCPDCGKMFSEYAECCPECGCPVEDAKAEQVSATASPQDPTNAESDSVSLHAESEKADDVNSNQKDSSNTTGNVESDKKERKDSVVTENHPSATSSPTPASVNEVIEEANVVPTQSKPKTKGKYWLILVLTVLVFGGCVLFLYHQCSKHEPSKHLLSDADSTVTEQTYDEKVQVTKEKLTYNSKDLATFELYGKVRSVTYNTDSPVHIYFNEYGDACYIKKYVDGDKSNVCNGIIKRSEEGQIIEIAWEGLWWYSIFRYFPDDDGDGNFSENVFNYIWGNGSDGGFNRTEYCFHYNEEGQLEEISSVGYIHDLMMGVDNTKVELKKVDSKGNWIERTCAIEDDIKVITRTIVYFE